MGRDKAWLRLGGKSLVAHVRKAAEEAGLPVRVIRRDLVTRCGPLGGVYTAMRTSKADVVLFLACDMPFVSSRLLHRLLAKLKPNTNAVFVGEEKAGFPFVLRRAALDQVQLMLAEGQLSLQALARNLAATLIKPAASLVPASFNINTREDYQAADKLWREFRASRARPLVRRAERRRGTGDQS
jgi:molybdopterin-guanine dinucleotide biosynthesis protein A